MGQGSGTRRIDALVAGVACTVDVGPPELTAAVSQVLPGPVGPQDQPPTAALHLRVERADGRDEAEQDALQRGATRYVLYADGRAVTAPCDAAAVIRALDHHLRFQVSVLASDLLQVHAGVVVWQDRAIVLPAPSGSGKSTLVLALVRAAPRSAPTTSRWSMRREVSGRGHVRLACAFRAIPAHASTPT